MLFAFADCRITLRDRMALPHGRAFFADIPRWVVLRWVVVEIRRETGRVAASEAENLKRVTSSIFAPAEYGSSAAAHGRATRLGIAGLLRYAHAKGHY
jgi:hypothetical protein